MSITLYRLSLLFLTYTTACCALKAVGDGFSILQQFAALVALLVALVVGTFAAVNAQRRGDS